MYPVKFYPIPVERVWGGEKLKSVFAGRCSSQIPEGPVGEYWVLSGHPHGTSRVVNGSLKGLTLVELTEQYPDEFLGQSPQTRFPLLIKFLEAEQDLSVQVHPKDAYAKRIENDYGKTEAWYVLDCKENGRVVYGHRFANREELRDAAETRRISEYLDYKAIRKGDMVFVPATTLHALLAGTQVIEVQQTSDVTYRVYDWDRMGSDGKPRELHLDKSADVLFEASGDETVSADAGDAAAAEDGTSGAGPERRVRAPWTTTDISSDIRLLVECPYFSMFELSIGAGKTVHFDRSGSVSPDVLILAHGNATLGYLAEEKLDLVFGDTVLIPTSLSSVDLSAGEKEVRALLVRYGN